MRRIFGPKRNKVTAEWRKLHDEGLNNLYSSPKIFRVIKSRRMRRAGHIAHRGERRGFTRFWSGNLRERDILEDSGVDGRIILRLILTHWHTQPELGCENMDCVDVAKDKDWWRPVVNAVMNLRVPQNAGNFLTN